MFCEPRIVGCYYHLQGLCLRHKIVRESINSNFVQSMNRVIEHSKYKQASWWRSNHGGK